MTIGHGITAQISEQSAAVASRRQSRSSKTRVVGFVGFWNNHIDQELVRRMLKLTPI